jgi:hypothetical protein
MKIRNVDINGDWVFGKGKNDYKKDLEALIVDLKTRIKEWKFDCFFAEQNGIDYKSFLNKGTKVFLDNDIKRVTLQTDGVLRINTFLSEIDPDTREYSVETSITSYFGDFTINF